MKIPMLRIALALSCMEGEKVDRWKGAYANKLADLCWLNGRMVAKMKKTDERLWDDFFIAFRTMFKDLVAIEHANYKLRTITMKGREVDEYINKFEDLLVLAECDRNEQGSIKLF